MKINDVVIAPVLTEKATGLLKQQVYTFQVALGASKPQVAAAVMRLYKVRVGVVKIVTRHGKVKRVGRTMRTKIMPDRKIAYVRLKEGTIDLFPKS